MVKKMTLMVLCCNTAMVTIALPLLALESGDYFYSINLDDTNTVTITDYIGYDHIVDIPPAIEGLAVTAIGDKAFYNQKGIIRVNIPDGVTSIGEYGFSLCTSLFNITIPNSITFIGDQAFDYCRSLTDIVIPDGVASLRYKAFYGCSELATVTLGSGLLSIDYLAFSGCKRLTSITIPENVRYISSVAFLGCTSLFEILVDEENSTFTSLDGIIFAENNTILLWCPVIKDGAYAIPDGVISIEPYAFENCVNLTSILMPDSLVFIGSFAFSDCRNLESVVFGNSTEYINNYAFRNCDSLIDITLPESVIHIGYGAFYSCENLTHIEMTASGTYLGQSVFRNCRSLVDITLPRGITSIGSHMFSSCSSLTSITVPSGVSYVEEYAFSYCANLTGVYFNGDAPFDAPDIFTKSNEVVVYYRAGTTGWGVTYADRPTMLWNPLIQTDDGSFGMQTNGFGFNIVGAANELVKVEVSTNLAENIWEPILTGSLTNAAVYFNDPDWTNHSIRYYRLNMP